jgi:hypothetical protein
MNQHGTILGSNCTEAVGTDLVVTWDGGSTPVHPLGERGEPINAEELLRMDDESEPMSAVMPLTHRNPKPTCMLQVTIASAHVLTNLMVSHCLSMAQSTFSVLFCA